VRWLARANRAPVPPPPLHRSPALKALLEGLDPDSRPLVLDLGATVPANIERLSAVSCRVRVADLPRALACEPAAVRDAEGADALVERLLPLEPGERFDAVLAWDVLDYLRPREVAALAARLAPACAPGAPLLALVSRRREVPQAPPRYRILDDETLASEGAEEPPRPGPRYGQGELQRLMPGFVVKHSVLLRSGVHEFLFARAAAGEASLVRAASPAREAPPAPAWFRRVPV
jgi:hypothetical protein